MPHRVRDAARATGNSRAFLPFRSPVLMSLEELWQGLKQPVAANRSYASLKVVFSRAPAWFDGMSNTKRHRRCNFEASKPDWLPELQTTL